MGQKKKTSPVKIIVITLIILALIGAAFFGAKKVRVSNTSVPVYLVSSLGWGPLEDEMSIDGMVYEQDSQTIYYDATILVDNVFVTEGQEVKEGDPLIQYNMESEKLAFQMAELGLQQLRNDMTAAKAELQALYNTTPIPEYTPDPEPEEPDVPPAPDDGDQVEKKQVKDAWTLLDGDSIEDYYLDPGVNVIVNTGKDSGNSAQNEDSQSDEGESEGEEGQDDSEDEASEDSDSDDPTDYQVPPAGSAANPYRYLVTEDGRIYGSFLNALRQMEDTFAVVEIRTKNSVDGDIIAALTLNSNRIKEQKDDDFWYVILHTEDEPSEEDPTDDPDDLDDDDDFPVGYTARELAEAIQETQEIIKEIDLDIRRAELDIKMMTEDMEDGVVKAKHNGVVTIAHTKDSPPQDGTPFIKVESGSGVTVQGNISELLLETIVPGQEITAYDWETSEYYTGKITKIDDYPVDNTYYYYGSGNPNSSFYGFLAYFDDAADMEAGHFLQMSLDKNANNETPVSLPNAYIRSDAQGRYVMKDEDGILVKQYVKCGKVYYAYVTEILEGLSEDDYVAFPYGDGQEEGAKTTVSEEEEYF